MPDILKIKIVKRRNDSIYVDLTLSDNGIEYVNKYLGKHIENFLSSYGNFEIESFAKETRIVAKSYIFWKHLLNA